MASGDEAYLLESGALQEREGEVQKVRGVLRANDAGLQDLHKEGQKIRLRRSPQAEEMLIVGILATWGTKSHPGHGVKAGSRGG